MKKINYNTIGDIDYTHEPRTVRKQGLIIAPSLVLKLYSMSKDLHPTAKTLKDTKEFLEKEIWEGKISQFSSGLGFTILSENMLNVAIWDNEYPLVLKNQIYNFNETINPAPLDIREVGSFCVWELGIVGYERNAWMEFLKSKRTKRDKQKYLEDFIEGELK